MGYKREETNDIFAKREYGVVDLDTDKVSTEVNATADEKGDFTFEKPENGTFFKVIGVRNFDKK